jgi:hypothetical protein
MEEAHVADLPNKLETDPTRGDRLEAPGRLPKSTPSEGRFFLEGADFASNDARSSRQPVILHGQLTETDQPSRCRPALMAMGAAVCILSGSGSRLEP